MATLDSIELRNSLEASLGTEAAAKALEAFRSEASVSVRLNPSKPTSSPLPILEGATPVPWSEHGWLLEKRPLFTMHPLFHAGAYYVQDSSAMFVGWLFRQMLDRVHEGRKLMVLDLCAAPGGKTTDLAASLRERFGDDFMLVSNEVMRQRASILSDNVAVWGDPNVMVTSVDPKAFAPYEGLFDMIVADVPCSGEGMFRKDARAVEEWSPENVEMCAARQRRILADVWPALREGGILVYSTCTFEKSENDDNLEWAAETLGGEIIEPQPAFDVRMTRHGYLLVPGEVPGEGQWAGAMVKTSSSGFCPRADLNRLRPLRYGFPKPELKAGKEIPNPDAALCIALDRNSYPMVEVDKLTALHYLHRDTIVLPDAPKGYLVLTYRGLPVGFVKNLGSRCNNLHPQSRRIRMDINIE